MYALTNSVQLIAQRVQYIRPCGDYTTWLTERMLNLGSFRHRLDPKQVSASAAPRDDPFSPVAVLVRGRARHRGCWTPRLLRRPSVGARLLPAGELLLADARAMHVEASNGWQDCHHHRGKLG